MTRLWRCLMKMWKLDRVHRVGIKLPVVFVVMAQSWTKCRPAFGFLDFIVLFASMVQVGPKFVQTCLCCGFASLQHYPIIVAQLLAILNLGSVRLAILSVFCSIVSPIPSYQQCRCVSFADSKLCLQLMSPKMSFVSPRTRPMMRHLQMELKNLSRLGPQQRNQPPNLLRSQSQRRCPKGRLTFV